MIHTPRLVLRALRVEDAEEMVTVLGDPALHEFIGGDPATLAELARPLRRWVAGSGSDDEVWLNWIVRRRDDEVSGGRGAGNDSRPRSRCHGDDRLDDRNPVAATGLRR